jgi:hypothetical protein
LGNSSDHHVMFVGKGGSNGLGFWQEWRVLCTLNYVN